MQKSFDSREKFLFTVQQSFGFIKELILLNKKKSFMIILKKVGNKGVPARIYGSYK